MYFYINLYWNKTSYATQPEFFLFHTLTDYFFKKKKKTLFRTSIIVNFIATAFLFWQMSTYIQTITYQ